MSEAATRPRSDVWLELLELAGEDSQERALLQRLVELFRETSGAAATALYVKSEGAFHREAESGAGGFPSLLPEEAEGRFRQVRLPGARLLHDAGEGLDPEGAMLLVALAGGVKSYRLRRALKKRHFEVNYRGVELEALYDVGLAIASTRRLEDLYGEILLRAVSLLDARRGALYLCEDGIYRLHETFGGEAREMLDPAAEAAVERLLASQTPEEQDVLPGSSHLLAVPIEVEGRPRGLLVVGDKESRHGVGPFTATDRRTLGLFANQAAIALENARLHRQELEKQRLERELELAAEIQRGLLPKATPQLAGVELLGWSRPARHVGGDYYDLLSLADGRLVLVLADVSGKGMPAALLVSNLHSAIRLLLDRLSVGPDLLARLNRHVYESSGSNKFITLSLAELDADGRRLQYLSAGHDPAILLRAGGQVETLPAGGLPLGVLPASRYCERTMSLEAGDLLCVYSDGITECAGPSEEEFGLDRLIALLDRYRDRPLPEIAAILEAETTRFAQGRPQGDDQTILLLRRAS